MRPSARRNATTRPEVRTTPESLQAALAKGPLPRVCLLTGVEPLADRRGRRALRDRARRDGYGDREVHFIERGFDWDALHADAQSLSLFSNLRLIELKLRSAPDATAAKHLVRLAAQPPADTVLLVVGRHSNRRPRKPPGSANSKSTGCSSSTTPVERDRLPAWITRRLQQRGVTLDEAAAELLADRVEGNLLAAQQEIERIALLQPGARLDAAAVAELVADNARFDVFELAAAAYLGNASASVAHPGGVARRGHRAALDPVGAGQRTACTVARCPSRAERDRDLDECVPRRRRSGRTARGHCARRCSACGARKSSALLRAAARADRVAKGSLRGEPWVEIVRSRRPHRGRAACRRMSTR